MTIDSIQPAALIGEVKKNYPALSEQRLRRMLATIEKMHVRGGAKQVAPIEFLKFILQIITDYDVAANSAGKISADAQKNINKNLNRNDIHLFSRAKHQEIRDFTRLTVLLVAVDALVSKKAINLQALSKISKSGFGRGQRSDLKSQAAHNKAGLTFEGTSPYGLYLKLQKIAYDRYKVFGVEAKAGGSSLIDTLRERAEMARQTNAKYEVYKEAYRLGKEEAATILDSGLRGISGEAKTRMLKRINDDSAKFKEVLTEIDEVFKGFNEAATKIAEEQEKYEAMKTKIAKGMFKLVASAAPPPFSLAGGLIASAASSALITAGNAAASVLDTLEAEIPEAIPSSQVNSALEGAQDKATQLKNEFKKTAASKVQSYFRTTTPPKPDVVKQDSLVKMLDAAKEQARDDGWEALDKALKKVATGYGVMGAIDNFGGQRANAMESIQEFLEFGSGTGPLDDTRKAAIRGVNNQNVPALARSDLNKKVEDKITEFLVSLDSDAAPGWFTSDGKKFHIRRYVELYLWGQYITSYVKDSKGLPDLWGEMSKRLAADSVNFLNRGSGAVIEDGDSVDLKLADKGPKHHGDHFLIFVVLMKYAIEGPSPLELLMDPKVNRAQMRKDIEDKFREYLAEAQATHSSVRGNSKRIRFRKRRQGMYGKEIQLLFNT